MLECKHCDHKVENDVNMKCHIREVHSQNKQIQTSSENIFCEYLCFYCERPLKSKDKLQLHRSKCIERTLTEFPCDSCGAQCVDKCDLGRHRTTYHNMGSVCKVTKKEVFWCNMCPMNFPRKPELHHHMEDCHGKEGTSDGAT